MRKVVFDNGHASRIQSVHGAIVNHVIERADAQNGAAQGHAQQSFLHADIRRERGFGVLHIGNRAGIRLDKNGVLARDFKYPQTTEGLDAFLHQRKT